MRSHAALAFLLLIALVEARSLHGKSKDSELDATVDLEPEEQMTPSHMDASRTMSVGVVDSVVEDSVETLVPFGAVDADHTTTVKKEGAQSPPASPVAAASFVDWLTLALAEELVDAIEASANATDTPIVDQPTVAPRHVSKLEWLKASLNFKKNADSTSTTTEQPTTTSSIASTARTHSKVVASLADIDEKEDAMKFEKSKFSWRKFNAAPVIINPADFVPLNNDIQIVDGFIDTANNFDLPPAAVYSHPITHKEQYFFDDDDI